MYLFFQLLNFDHGILVIELGGHNLYPKSALVTHPQQLKAKLKVGSRFTQSGHIGKRDRYIVRPSPHLPAASLTLLS